MKRKGISPLIAAVLLIAFTMAVASIFAQWAPQLIKDAQGDTSETAQNIQKCSGINLEVVSGDHDSATIQQKTGKTAVGNVSVTWFYDTEDPVQDYVNISSSRGSARTTGGNSSLTNSDLTRIELDPIDCEGAPTSTYTP